MDCQGSTIYHDSVIRMDSIRDFTGKHEISFINTNIVVTANGMLVITVDRQRAVTVENQLAFTEKGCFLVFAAICCIGGTIRQYILRVIIQLDKYPFM